MHQYLTYRIKSRSALWLWKSDGFFGLCIFSDIIKMAAIPNYHLHTQKNNPKTNKKHITFWKRALHKYVHICMHICTCETLFTKTQSLNSALTLQAHFLEWRLTRFGKEVFIYYVYSAELVFSKCRDTDHQTKFQLRINHPKIVYITYME